MMTRKDYVSTADILNNYVEIIEPEIFDNLVAEFVEMFRKDNDRFIASKFVEACLGSED